MRPGKSSGSYWTYHLVSNLVQKRSNRVYRAELSMRACQTFKSYAKLDIARRAKVVNFKRNKFMRSAGLLQDILKLLDHKIGNCRRFRTNDNELDKLTSGLTFTQVSSHFSATISNNRSSRCPKAQDHSVETSLLRWSRNFSTVYV